MEGGGRLDERRPCTVAAIGRCRDSDKGQELDKKVTQVYRGERGEWRHRKRQCEVYLTEGLTRSLLQQCLGNSALTPILMGSVERLLVSGPPTKGNQAAGTKDKGADVENPIPKTYTPQRVTRATLRIPGVSLEGSGDRHKTQEDSRGASPRREGGLAVTPCPLVVSVLAGRGSCVFASLTSRLQACVYSPRPQQQG